MIAHRSRIPFMAWQDQIVQDVLEYLAGGGNEDQILADFPDLTRGDIRATLAFAAARERPDPSPAPARTHRPPAPSRTASVRVVGDLVIW